MAVAPAAIFCLTDIVPHLDDLATAMMQCQRAMPRGRVEDEVGPEWRRRVGLARRLGQLREGPGWAITVLPPQYFEPVALPRMLSLIPVSGPDKFGSGSGALARPTVDHGYGQLASSVPCAHMERDLWVVSPGGGHGADAAAQVTSIA